MFQAPIRRFGGLKSCSLVFKTITAIKYLMCCCTSEQQMSLETASGWI